MRTTIFVPDTVFHEAEELAQRLGWSRSQLYAQAVRELIARNVDDRVTAALNALADETPTDADETPTDIGLSAGRALIQKGEWEW